MAVVLFNPLSNNGRGRDEVENIPGVDMAKVRYEDITKITNYHEFFETVGDDSVILSGGDGTLHNFANNIPEECLNKEIYYYPTGSGNDFANDIEYKKGSEPVYLTDYLKNLPTVTLKGVKKKFLNDVGFGIDGYCCEKGDEARAKSSRPVNYTTIALKGLLYDYKPGKVHVEADGKVYDFDHVWMAPTMFGRFYGGGMMVTPMQNRNNPNHTMTVAIVHSKGRFALLKTFPRIFKGTHASCSNVITFIENVRHVTVEFEEPTSVQLDGETYLNVKTIEAKAATE
ncbi:MAG: diacylglycerol kinase family protein [Lachnospiraceae bacterium]|nr:diacylglycerol kinase family protein [Lachnospiraceae bacterium]